MARTSVIAALSASLVMAAGGLIAAEPPVTQGQSQGAVHGQGFGVGNTPRGEGIDHRGVGVDGQAQGRLNGRGFDTEASVRTRATTRPGDTTGVGIQGKGQGRLRGNGVGVDNCATPPCGEDKPNP